jgi:tRNA 2-selenouridine synthase
MDRQELADATARIQKKLGGLETKTALQHLDNNDLFGCFDILLKYYDKLYTKSLLAREEYMEENKTYKKEIISEVVDPMINARKMMEVYYGRS